MTIRPGAKTIRLFVSSTFRDMHAERDWLNRVVFPELRSRCRRRGVEFVGVDLRWGVTDEESLEKGALAVCQEEIRRCDLFLALLGERYGWVPPPEEIPAPFFHAARGASELKLATTRLLDTWYQLDKTVEPPVFRLRRSEKIPPDIADALIRLWEQAGLPGAGESVTEREIRAGALKPEQRDGRAFLYLRNEGVHNHRHFPQPLEMYFRESSPERRERLLRLRKEIVGNAGNHVTVREYQAHFAGFRIDPLFLPARNAADALADGIIEPAEWEGLSDDARRAVHEHGTVALSGIEELGVRILADLWGSIEGLLKENRRPSAEGRAEHDRFITERTALFLERGDLVGQILGYLQGSDSRMPLVVTGPPGCGKSSLLAECARRFQEESPSTLVIPWFAGAAPGSTDTAVMIRALCEQLRRACQLDLEPSPDPDKLRLQLPGFLAAAAAVRPVALIIDGINQIARYHGSEELDWLPLHLTQRVKLVVSTLPGPSLHHLSLAVPTANVITVPGLSAEHQRQLVVQRLALRGKKLSVEQLGLLLDSAGEPERALPLYLVVAIEELCCHGDYESLAKRIAELPTRVAALFDQVLDRLERDHGATYAKLTLPAIAVSRAGLLEAEVIDLAKPGGQDVAPLRWARFYRALEPYLRPRDEVSGAGLISFFHDQLRFAVYRRYLFMEIPESQSSPELLATHRRLVEYFRGRASNPAASGHWRSDQPRALGELPHHLAGAGDTEKLRALLLDYGWISAKFQALDTASLLEDYGLLPDDPVLVQIRKALQLAANVVATDRKQFTGQFTGRILTCREPEVIDLVGQAERHEKGPWLRVLQPSLFQAGGAIERVLGAHTHPVRALAISPDDRRIVSAADDATLRLWDRASGAELMVFRGHEAEVLTVAFFPDRRRIVSGSRDATVRIWDMETGECLHLLRGHGMPVSSVAVAPDGQWLASGSWDNSIRFWNPLTGEERGIIWGHAFGVNALAVTPDSGTLVSASFDCSIKTWDTATGELRRTLTGHHRQVLAVAVTPNGRQLVSGSEDCTVKRWDLEEGRELWTYTGHSEAVSSVAVLPDGREMLSGSWDFTIRRWDLKNHRAIGILRGHTFKVSGVAVTSDGATAVSAAMDTTLKIWNLGGAARTLPAQAHGATVTAVAYSPDGGKVLTVSWDRTIKVWEASTGTELFTLSGHEQWIRDVAVTPCGRWAVTASHDRTIRVWDLEERRELWILRGHGGEAWSVVITPDGKRAFSTGSDNTLREWDLESFREIGVTGLPHPVRVVAITPDSSQLVLVDHSAAFIVKDLSSGYFRPYPPQHRDQVNHVAILPDGRRALSASSDRTLKLWNLETGQVLYTLRGHTREIWSVAVSPDGKRAASASDDRTLIVWDLTTLKAIATFTGDGALVPCAISPDGAAIVTGDEAGIVHFLRLSGKQ